MDAKEDQLKRHLPSMSHQGRVLVRHETEGDGEVLPELGQYETVVEQCYEMFYEYEQCYEMFCFGVP